MPEDLRTLLLDAAATPSRPVDPVRVHAVRVRRQILTWLVAVSVTAVAAVVVVPAVFERPPRSPIVEQPSITPTEGAQSPTTGPDSQWPPSGLPKLASVGWPAGPSQTTEAAERDGVVAEVAALPLDQRIGVVDAAVTTEGVWVVSRNMSNAAGGGIVGDASGVYGRDYVALTEYGEILLLDPDTFEVLRAWPLPGLPPTRANANVDRLVVTDQAVYVAHQGDGALPDSWVAHIDRASLVGTIRVFPTDPGFTADDPRLAAWDVRVHDRAVSLQQGLVVTADHVVTLGYDRTVLLLDLETLDVIDELTLDGRPAPGPEGTLAILDDRDRIQGFVYAADPTAVIEMPLPDTNARLADVVDTSTYGALLLLAGERDWILARRSGNGWEQTSLPGPGPDTHTATLAVAGEAAFVLYDDVVVDVSTGEPQGRYIIDWPSPDLPPDEDSGPRPASTNRLRGSLVTVSESQAYLLIGPYRFALP